MTDSQGAATTAPPPPDLDPEQLVNRRLMLQLALLLAIAFAAVLAGIGFNRQLENLMPEQETFPSVYNHKPSGTSGAMELMHKAGMGGKEWVLPYRQLSTIRGALVIISPSESPGDFEIEQILDWVSRGNTLIYFDDFAFKIARRLLAKLGVDAKEGTPLNDWTFNTARAERPVFHHVQDLTLSAESRLTGAPPLVSDRSGTVLAELKHGKGRILLGTVPSLISNRRLSSPASWPNFQFFVNWLGNVKGSVWFDERCHGFSKNANVFFFLGRGPAGLMLVQILLALLVSLVSASQRFGRAQTLETKRKISNLEFINGLANTYSRAHANGAALEIIAQALRAKLCKTISISPHEPTDQVIEALHSIVFLTESSKSSIEKFLRDYEAALKDPALSDNEFKALIIRCDKIAEQLNQAVQQATAGGTGTDDNK